MAGPMQKVKRGDPLVIPAATFNTFIDAARDFQDRQRTARRDAVREQRDTGIVLVRNESGEDRERFDVLGIEGPIIERIDNEDEFKQRVALRGIVPSSPHPGKFAILLEPAKDQAIVRACVDGVCVVRVRMVDEAHTSADVAVGVASRLESGDSGTARLLWVEPVEDRQDPEIAWTVARIGGGIAAQRNPRMVMVQKDGGAAGSLGATCSFTYRIWAETADPLEDEPLAAGLSPHRARMAFTKYEAAADFSYGLAHYDETLDRWTLLDCLQERPARSAGCAAGA